LARVTDDSLWRDLAVRTVGAYTGVLLDPATGLFRHGYDVRERVQSPCNWGRGNGWAMHGLIDTLAELAADDPAGTGSRALLMSQMRTVARLQDGGGSWHTILDDPTSPLENSTPAFFASALLKAVRLGLVERGSYDATITRALAALAGMVDDDGGLPVSYATPVGD